MDNLLLYTLNKAQKGGGTPTPTTEPSLRLIDWEGTVLKDYSLEEAMELTELPNPATLNSEIDREYLTFNRWNWTISEIKGFCESYPDYTIVVGATYNISDNRDHYYYEGEEVSSDSQYIDTAKLWNENFMFKNNSHLKRVCLSSHINVCGRSFGLSGCDNIEVVVIPHLASVIAEGLFLGCKNLKCVSVNSGMLTIRSYSFANCSSLENLTFREVVAEIGAFDGCVSLKKCVGIKHTTPGFFGKEKGASLYKNCASLKEIPSFNNRTPIGEEFASGCISLMNFSIPYLLNPILYSRAFSGCSSLSDISLSSHEDWSDIKFGSEVFKDCVSLENVSFPITVYPLSSTGYESLFEGCLSLKSVTLGCVPKGISSGWFKNCLSLETFTITSQVDNTEYIIGDSSFENCHYLNGLTMPNPKSIGDYAFENCSALESINLTEAESIGAYAFAECRKLYITALSNSLNVIGEYAFSNVPFGENLVIPNSVTSIGCGAFYGRYNYSRIKRIVIPSSVTDIPDPTPSRPSKNGQFEGCKNLTDVEIYASCETLPPYIFKDCPKLSTVRVGSGISEIDSRAFSGTTNSTFTLILEKDTKVDLIYNSTSSVPKKIYVPDDLVSAYKADNNWLNYAGQMSWQTWTRSLDNVVFPMSELPTE